MKDEPKTIVQRKAPLKNQSSFREPQFRENNNSSDIRLRQVDSRKQSILKHNQQTIDKSFVNQIKVNHLDQVIRIQAVIRGVRTRFMTQILKKTLKVKKKYFIDEELWETINKNKIFKLSYAKVTKEYVYKCSGAIYNGEWKQGFRYGKGLMQWPDGAKYEGEWELGRAYGRGIFTHTKGEIYDGQWINDKAHGYGVYVHSNGAKYEGMWRQDLQHGQGKESWPDGSLFTGEYADGKKNGRGKYLWVDGASYDGNWEENEISGYGFYKWADGRKYIGHWKGNIMDEFGIYTWQDGRMYEGFYLEDKKHGYGIYTWSDSKRYAGWWSNGKQHGIGIFISKDGKKKLGLWEDGKKVKWFSQDEISLIESDQGDSFLRSVLTGGEESWQRIKEFPKVFSPEEDFYKMREYLAKKIQELQIEDADMIDNVQISYNQSIMSIQAGDDQGNLM
ncbi:UNKNOWN [Stylonychia lemnae]|uniref:Morn repeat protein n=1 Tax=Stylonychia lemnae TaxID=5949 RepID=A0A078A9Q2_STYLE|nr:UNKNOWN [Stylonychia lemnae]|eukprot:CDW78312.1 UNKNOWN [Stylonychia lemnae]